MIKGLVVSDLHMFTGRTRAEYVLGDIYGALRDCDLLVLNGDIFDFRWTTLSTVSHTIKEAVAWLENLTIQYPGLKVHYIQGNHDCSNRFSAALETLTTRAPGFYWHRDCLFLQNAVFLHGDCVHRKVGAKGLEAYRKPWKNVRKKGRTANACYGMLMKSGIVEAMPKLVFRPERMAKRILSYLNEQGAFPNTEVEHVFVGHTHVPFQDFSYGGKLFHNTGCALFRNRFNLLRFEMHDFSPAAGLPVIPPFFCERAEPLDEAVH